jgi:hypothetical protein
MCIKEDNLDQYHARRLLVFLLGLVLLVVGIIVLFVLLHLGVTK